MAELTSSIKRGAVWLMLDTGFSRAASLVSQTIVAIYLSTTDFAEYALVLGSTLALRVFQDAGTRDHLVAVDESEYRRDLGPSLWGGACVNLVIAALIIALGWPVGRIYDIEEMPAYMAVFALSVLLGSGWAAGQATLRRRLAFRSLVLVSIVAGTVQFGGAILLAYRGYGVLSFLWPLCLAQLIRSAGSLWQARVVPWRQAPRPSAWRHLFARSRWLVISAIAMNVVAQGDYVVLGVLLDSVALGYYFFAYQLANQVLAVVAGNAEMVLLPALGLARHRAPEQDSRRMLTIVSILAVLSSGLAGTLAVAFPIMNTLIWSGDWTESAEAFYAFCAAMPWMLIYIVLRMGLLTRQRYRAWTWYASCFGVVIVVSALVGGLLFRTPGPVAACTAIGMLAIGVASLIRSADLWATERGAVIRRALGPWAGAAIGATVATAVSEALLETTSADFASVACFIVLLPILVVLMAPSACRDVRGVLTSRFRHGDAVEKLAT